MSTQYFSKHGIVSRPPYELYMQFVDLRNFVNMLPEDKKAGVTADFDTISFSVQNFQIGVRVQERTPYSRIAFVDNGAPLKFNILLRFDDAPVPSATDFSIEINTELNLMMKMMIGNKIQEAIDNIVDSLVDISNGKMPDGVDPSMLDKFKTV